MAPIHVASSSRGEANLLQKFQNIQKQGTRGSPLRNEAARGTSSQSTKLPGGIKEEDEEEQDRPTNGVAKKTNVLLPSSERRANTAGSNPTTRVVANEKADTKLASGKNEGIYNKVTNTLTSAINYRARGDKLELPGEILRTTLRTGLATEMLYDMQRNRPPNQPSSLAGSIMLTNMAWVMRSRMARSVCNSTTTQRWL